MGCRGNVPVQQLLAAFLLSVCACSSTAPSPDASAEATAGADAADDGGLVDIGGCKVPAALTSTDDASGQCRRAARAALSCTNATGAGELCVSNGSQCASDDNTNANGIWTCDNECGPSEFAIICGVVGPGPEITPPPGCRSALLTPGGTAYYCCGCGA